MSVYGFSFSFPLPSERMEGRDQKNEMIKNHKGIEVRDSIASPILNTRLLP